MNKIKIEEQENVLNACQKSAIVSASAGSGKTSVMVDKIMKYVSEGICFKNILALTFTNRAAFEMKTRLFSALSDSIEKSGRAELAEELDFLPQADISTFHSFYEKIVKKYFYVVKIQPNFEIVSNEKLVSLKETAFKRAIEKLKENNFEKYLKISEVLGKKRSDNSIKERIFKLESFLSSQFDSGKWLERTSTVMYENSDETFASFFSEIFGAVDSTISELSELLVRAKEFSEEGLCGHINNCINDLTQLKAGNFKEVYENIFEKFSFPILRKSKQIEETETFFKVKEAKEKFNYFLKKIKRNNFGNFENIVASFETCKNNINSIIALYSDFKMFLNKEKKELNVYDFSDLENLCYQILLDENIGQEIKENYRQIFIDEFQDINPIQNKILSLISNNNVLYVGDAKQSIYAFRQSDVDIFVETCSNFLNYENSEAFKLNCNFRTNKEILNFANQVFNNLMTEKNCGINYEKDAQFNGLSQNGCENESVKIIEVVEEETPPEEQINSVFSLESCERNFKQPSLEAKIIAAEISNLIEQNIFLNGETRKINFGDIAILVRNRSELVSELATVLSKYNIPFNVGDEIDLFSSKDVNLLISVLKLCLNLKDDFNLAPVLASKLFDLSNDDLVRIKLKEEGNFYYERCENYVKNNTDLISEKLNYFYKTISQLKFEITTKGVKEAIENFLTDANYLNYVLAQEDGFRRKNRIKQFLKHLEEAGFNHDLYNLIIYLNSLNAIKVSSINPSNDNCVTITTIHSSKGLEYPVVFLTDCGKDLNKTKPETEDLKIDKTLGLAIKNYNNEERKVYDSVFERIITTKNKRKEIAENIRLLYVALTRCKNKLIIIGKKQKEIVPITKETDLLYRSGCFLNYILGSILGKEIKGLKAETISFQDYEEQGKAILEQFDLQPILTARENINFNYKNKDNVNLALKTSVSQVSLEQENYESIVDAPHSFLTSDHLKDLTRAEQGNLFHMLLEKIEFKSLNLEKDLKDLVEKNCTKQESKYVFDLTLKNINLIKNLLPKNNKTFKEKQFMVYASPFEIFGRGSEEKILIQGKLDLFSYGEKNILIDYKFSSILNEEKLREKYLKQLLAYSFAVEKATGEVVSEVYLLNLKQCKLIKIK